MRRVRPRWKLRRRLEVQFSHVLYIVWSAAELPQWFYLSAKWTYTQTIMLTSQWRESVSNIFLQSHTKQLSHIYLPLPSPIWVPELWLLHARVCVCVCVCSCVRVFVRACCSYVRGCLCDGSDAKSIEWSLMYSGFQCSLRSVSLCRSYRFYVVRFGLTLHL